MDREDFYQMGRLSDALIRGGQLSDPRLSPFRPPPRIVCPEYSDGMDYMYVHPYRRYIYLRVSLTFSCIRIAFPAKS